MFDCQLEKLGIMVNAFLLELFQPKYLSGLVNFLWWSFLFAATFAILAVAVNLTAGRYDNLALSLTIRHLAEDAFVVADIGDFSLQAKGTMAKYVEITMWATCGGILIYPALKWGYWYSSSLTYIVSEWGCKNNKI